MFRYAGALLLGAVLTVPVAMRADEHRDRVENHDRRYYDAERKDYHEWNEREDQAYRRWLEERHRQHRDFTKASKQEQREYWRWRHEHPDQERH